MISQIGVQGEHLKLYQGDGLNNVSWTSTSEPPKMQPLTWYKVMNSNYEYIFRLVCVSW